MKFDELTLEELKELRQKLDEKIKEWEPYDLFSKPVHMKTVITYPQAIYIEPYEVCMIDEFFKQEQLKPPHLRSSACLIACPCSRHTIMC